MTMQNLRKNIFLSVLQVFLSVLWILLKRTCTMSLVPCYSSPFVLDFCFYFGCMRKFEIVDNLNSEISLIGRLMLIHLLSF